MVINQGYLRTQPIVRNHVPLGSLGKDVKPPSYLYGFFELILSSSTRQLCEQNCTARNLCKFYVPSSVERNSKGNEILVDDSLSRANHTRAIK